jgi:hypothetical protein
MVRTRLQVDGSWRSAEETEPTPDDPDEDRSSHKRTNNVSDLTAMMRPAVGGQSAHDVLTQTDWDRHVAHRGANRVVETPFAAHRGRAIGTLFEVPIEREGIGRLQLGGVRSGKVE